MHKYFRIIVTSLLLSVSDIVLLSQRVNCPFFENTCDSVSTNITESLEFVYPKTKTTECFTSGLNRRLIQTVKMENGEVINQCLIDSSFAVAFAYSNGNFSEYTLNIGDKYTLSINHHSDGHPYTLTEMKDEVRRYTQFGPQMDTLLFEQFSNFNPGRTSFSLNMMNEEAELNLMSNVPSPNLSEYAPSFFKASVPGTTMYYIGPTICFRKDTNEICRIVSYSNDYTVQTTYTTSNGSIIVMKENLKTGEIKKFKRSRYPPKYVSTLILCLTEMRN